MVKRYNHFYEKCKNRKIAWLAARCDAGVDTLSQLCDDEVINMGEWLRLKQLLATTEV